MRNPDLTLFLLIKNAKIWTDVVSYLFFCFGESEFEDLKKINYFAEETLAKARGGHERHTVPTSNTCHFVKKSNAGKGNFGKGAMSTPTVDAINSLCACRDKIHIDTVKTVSIVVMKI